MYRHRTVSIKQETINIATYLQLHMAGTSRYTYLPTSTRYARKTKSRIMGQQSTTYLGFSPLLDRPLEGGSLSMLLDTSRMTAK